MKCLILIEVRDTKTTEELSSALTFVDENFDLMAISSIYELAYDKENIDKAHKLRYVNSKAIVIASSVETELEPKEIVNKITAYQSFENRKLTHSSIHLFLLFCENKVSMLPSLYLPHPELISRKDWLLAAAELWPSFEHPVLEESLEFLCRQKKIQSSDYFFAQGKSLLTLNLKDK